MKKLFRGWWKNSKKMRNLFCWVWWVIWWLDWTIRSEKGIWGIERSIWGRNACPKKSRLTWRRSDKFFKKYSEYLGPNVAKWKCQNWPTLSCFWKKWNSLIASFEPEIDPTHVKWVVSFCKKLTSLTQSLGFVDFGFCTLSQNRPIRWPRHPTQ
jgi:hypothetical protein